MPKGTPNKVDPTLVTPQLTLIGYARDKLRLDFDPHYRRIPLSDPDKEVIDACADVLAAFNVYVGTDPQVARAFVRTIVNALVQRRYGEANI